MNGTRRDLAKRVDEVCRRINDGLTAMAIVLAALVFLTAAYRVATVPFAVPEGFAIVATT
jgi:hypothetical protein